jgi:predicted RNase H-like nuclease
MAYYAWYWGPAGYEVYGDMTHGYILVPMTEWLRRRLTRPESKGGHTGKAPSV